MHEDRKAICVKEDIRYTERLEEEEEIPFVYKQLKNLSTSSLMQYLPPGKATVKPGVDFCCQR